MHSATIQRVSSTIYMGLTVAIAGLLHACSGGGGGSSPPPPGFLSGIVTASVGASPLAGVSITVFDANTNAPVNSTTQTIANGTYSISLTAGSYYVKLSRQGYDPVPPSPLLTPVPMSVASGATTTNDVAMNASSVANGGWIQGKVSNSAGTGLGGVLVAAQVGNSASTSISDGAGNFAIFNLPAASYSVRAHVKDLGFSAQNAVVTANTATTSDLAAAPAAATGAAPVNFNLIAQTGVTTPVSMLISLVHPITRETIPGLSQSLAFQNALSFSLGGVADSSYIVRASFANDTIVVDPDAIVKFGEPSVTVTTGSPSPNPVAITATGAVQLFSPSNAVASTVPVAATTTPTFIWDAYPSSSHYVVEVMDAATGAVIWGGFSGTGAGLTRNVFVPSSQTSVVFNVDNTATAQLVSGRTYRWRIYASKNDNQATLGWSLISMSEDQRGLIRIQ